MKIICCPSFPSGKIGSRTSLIAYYYTLKTDGQVFLPCDSWYQKGCVAGLVEEYHNLDIICNTRVGTTIYDLPPKGTGKIGVCPVPTRLWGECVVYIIVTL